MPEIKSFAVRKRLPTNYYTHIGRVVSRLAYLEWRLRRVTYALMRATPQEGRIAIREPRIDDHLTMIEDLLFVRGIRIRTNLASLREPLRKIESWRDKVSHGIWIKHPADRMPILEDIRGTHPPAVFADPRARNARINPKPTRVTPDNFKNWVRIIDRAIKLLDQLAREFSALQRASLRGKSPSPSPQTPTSPQHPESVEAPEPRR